LAAGPPLASGEHREDAADRTTILALAGCSAEDLALDDRTSRTTPLVTMTTTTATTTPPQDTLCQTEIFCAFSNNVQLMQCETGVGEPVKTACAEWCNYKYISQHGCDQTYSLTGTDLHADTLWKKLRDFGYVEPCVKAYNECAFANGGRAIASWICTCDWVARTSTRSD
jgi:hypothetical protein